MQADGVAPLATVSLPSVVDAVEVGLGSRSLILGARPGKSVLSVRAFYKTIYKRTAAQGPLVTGEVVNQFYLGHLGHRLTGSAFAVP